MIRALEPVGALIELTPQIPLGLERGARYDAAYPGVFGSADLALADIASASHPSEGLANLPFD